MANGQWLMALNNADESNDPGISGEERNESLWSLHAIIFAGGSASGKSTLISKYVGFIESRGVVAEVLSTDTYGEEQIEVHNNAARYARENPERLDEAESVVRRGLFSRFPNKALDNKVQNLVLDYNSTTVQPSTVTALLSNGAHTYKKAYFTRHIDEFSRSNKGGVLILDMTGKEEEVASYSDYLNKKGYMVHLHWVVASRSQALIWNAMRRRCMKISGVHKGHIAPNSYLLDAIQDSRSNGWKDVTITFTSTEDLRTPLDPSESFFLTKEDGAFHLSRELAERIRRVLGPLEEESYVPEKWIKDFFLRYRVIQSVAKYRSVECPQITDLLVSLQAKDKKENEANIKQFYKSLGMKEPALPDRPHECYDVNYPVREQFADEGAFERAVELYPAQVAAHERALAEWAEYELFFDEIGKRCLE